MKYEPLVTEKDDNDILEFYSSKNRLIRHINIVSSTTAIISWIVSYAFYIYTNQISNFHFIAYNNLPMKFEISVVIIFLIALVLIVIKSIFLYFLITKKDSYIISILNERANYFYVLNDILMSLGLFIPVMLKGKFEVSTSICIVLCGAELIIQEYCYTKFKNKRNINWRIQICYFLFTVLRIGLLSFQIINGFCFYLFNLYNYTNLTLTIYIVVLDSILLIVGILHITYFRDVFLLVVYMILNLGILIGNSTGGLSVIEFVSCLSLISFSIIILIYVIVFYKESIWGDKPFEESIKLNQEKYGRSYSFSSSFAGGVLKDVV